MERTRRGPGSSPGLVVVLVLRARRALAVHAACAAKITSRSMARFLGVSIRQVQKLAHMHVPRSAMLALRRRLTLELHVASTRAKPVVGALEEGRP